MQQQQQQTLVAASFDVLPQTHVTQLPLPHAGILWLLPSVKMNFLWQQSFHAVRENMCVCLSLSLSLSRSLCVTWGRQKFGNLCLKVKC